MEVECEVLLSVPGLTGCLGQCEGRRRAGSPPECQQWSHRRSRERTAHRAPPGCCAGSSGGGNISCLEICPSHQGAIYQSQQDHYEPGASYRADASLRVAGVRVAIALTELTVAQVQTSSRASISSCTVLKDT